MSQAAPLSVPAHEAPLSFRAVRTNVPVFARSGTALVLTQASNVGDASERYDDAFVAAVRVYERRHWPQAYAQFAKLGDHGNAPAAKLALLMLRYGHALYGETFTAPPTQIARWAQCVLRAGARSSVTS